MYGAFFGLIKIMSLVKVNMLCSHLFAVLCSNLVDYNLMYTK